MKNPVILEVHRLYYLSHEPSPYLFAYQGVCPTVLQDILSTWDVGPKEMRSRWGVTYKLCWSSLAASLSASCLLQRKCFFQSHSCCPGVPLPKCMSSSCHRLDPSETVSPNKSFFLHDVWSDFLSTAVLDFRVSVKGQKAGRDQGVTSGETVFIRTHSEGKPLSCGNGESLQREELTGSEEVDQLWGLGSGSWSPFSWTCLLQAKQTIWEAGFLFKYFSLSWARLSKASSNLIGILFLTAVYQSVQMWLTRLEWEGLYFCLWLKKKFEIS